MDDVKARLERLGQEVARVSDRTARPEVLSAARQRWLSPEVDARPRGSGQRWLVLAGACAACALAVWLLVLRPPPAVSFAIGAPPVEGAVGEWIAAGADRPLAVRFSEGTELSLSPGARARVTETSARGAAVLIERGELRASVVHRASGTRWALHAGPFEVRVTGTTLDVAWDPAAEQLQVQMEEGTVIVTGPLLTPGRELRAGERLRVSVKEQRLELTSGAGAALAAPPAETAPDEAAPPAEAAPANAPAPTEAALVAPVASAPGSARATSRAAAEAPAAEAPEWRALAGAGKHREAMAAAERAGITADLGRASSSDLLVLADTARFAGRPALARDALLSLRRRFGVTGRSAFLLGKIAADQLRSGGEAVTWFETYLREEPGGPLAEQALGRLMELKRRGDPAGARAVAERYLARYPGGAYAPLAKSLVSP